MLTKEVLPLFEMISKLLTIHATVLKEFFEPGAQLAEHKELIHDMRSELTKLNARAYASGHGPKAYYNSLRAVQRFRVVFVSDFNGSSRPPVILTDLNKLADYLCTTVKSLQLKFYKNDNRAVYVNKDLRVIVTKLDELASMPEEWPDDLPDFREGRLEPIWKSRTGPTIEIKPLLPSDLTEADKPLPRKGQIPKKKQTKGLQARSRNL